MRFVSRIDAHVHLWRYSADEYAWIDGTMHQLQRDFLPDQLAEVMDGACVDAGIAIAARQSVEESRFLLRCVDRSDRLCGVVGWVPLLETHALAAALDELCANPRFRGVREIAQGEPPGFLERSEFQRGVAQLTERKLAYDLLIFADQLQEAARLVDAHPEQQFVIDHCAKPHIAAGQLEPWATDLRELAARHNVVCKLSGLATEARWGDWSAETLRPYVDLCVDAFGPKRLIVGSDWPVCTLASSYGRWWKMLDEYFAAYSESERAWIFAEGARQAYKLPDAAAIKGRNG